MSILDKYLPSTEGIAPHPMNRREFIRRYKEFVHKNRLGPREAVVGAGGSCLMFGLRQVTNDIDLSVPDKIFDMYLKKGHEHKVYTNPDVEIVVYDDYIDLHRPDNSGIEIEEVDGVWTWTAEETLKFKLKMNRPKDQEDIKKLKILLDNK